MWRLQSRGVRTAVSDTRLFRSKGRGYSGTVISEYVSIGPIAVPEELDAQKLNFDAAAVLRDYQSLPGRPGEVAVLDTNTMLHYRPFNEVRRKDKLGFKPVRLVAARIRARRDSSALDGPPHQRGRHARAAFATSSGGPGVRSLDSRRSVAVPSVQRTGLEESAHPVRSPRPT
jgi:hypothetical protein